ncbi:MAG: hypothetical protein B6229_00210 [Spirochaetaceae bacterium 4572_7]|nr:MAG: hypothetical protein B6229_00210 [Spirochaetaceae bacterium 4572_7]
MKKRIILLIIVIMINSCSKKQDNLAMLNKTIAEIEVAQNSNDIEFIEFTIEHIEKTMPLFPKHQSLREKKALLEIRLKRYKSAIKTLDDLFLINPTNIDFMIIQGIILEIDGSIAKSDKTLYRALDLLENKKKYFSSDKKEILKRINKLIILKLLRLDTDYDYMELLSESYIKNSSEFKKSIMMIRNSNRDVFINRYR